MESRRVRSIGIPGELCGKHRAAVDGGGTMTAEIHAHTAAFCIFRADTSLIDLGRLAEFIAPPKGQ